MIWPIAFVDLLETIYKKLKTLLNSDVTRRELIDFTNFPLKTHIYVYPTSILHN